jgi:hypothetical protein
MLRRELQRRLRETAIAVLPLCLFLVVFQIGVLRASIDNAATVVLGLVVAFFGLMLFIQGLRLGLMPLAEGVGSLLPQRAGLVPAFRSNYAACPQQVLQRAP